MNRDIAQRIADLRRERGLSQDELAELVGVHRVTIAKYETGRIEPGAQALRRIADALEISADVLLGRSSEEQEEQSQQPRTTEARTVAYVIDNLTKEQREVVVNVITAMYPDVFRKVAKKD